MSVAERLLAALRTIPDFPKPGIQFKDITPILKDPDLLQQTVQALAEPFIDQGITQVVGIEARGFILGGLLADRLGTGFIPIRKKGKLPAETVAITYALEYGTDTIEMHADALGPEDRVLLHDDVLATGGTAAAACDLIAQTGATIVSCAFLMELDFLHGRQNLGNISAYSLLHI